MLWNTLKDNAKNKESVTALKRKLRLEMEPVAFVQFLNRN